MSKLNPPFRADHVGSLMRPQGLLAARKRRRDGEISGEQLRVIEDTHIRDVVKHKTVVLGLITTKVADLESQTDLIRRVEEAGQYMPLENMCLSPQCGFSSTVEGNLITERDQWAKLRLVVDTAREVWSDA